jgi:serine/threonine protein kinase
MFCQVLLSLLTASLGDLGFTCPAADGLEFKSALGTGGSSMVYLVTCDGQERLAKVFKAGKGASADAEVAALQAFQTAGVKHVPQLVRSMEAHDGARLLVVSPVGTPVLPLPGGVETTGEQLADLVDVLKAAHDRGLAHRDVKPANIFVADRHVILNDWGSSCPLGVEVAWQGTVGYSNPPEGGGQRHTPTKEDDLKALVRSAYVMSMVTGNSQLPHMDGFWDARLREGTAWASALAAAYKGDYEGVKAALSLVK